MPNLDGTGREGRGALTGRGLGNCVGANQMSFGFGRARFNSKRKMR